MEFVLSAVPSAYKYIYMYSYAHARVQRVFIFFAHRLIAVFACNYIQFGHKLLCSLNEIGKRKKKFKNILRIFYIGTCRTT